jgi:hypothetical protein
VINATRGADRQNPRTRTRHGRETYLVTSR